MGKKKKLKKQNKREERLKRSKEANEKATELEHGSFRAIALKDNVWYEEVHPKRELYNWLEIHSERYVSNIKLDEQSIAGYILDKEICLFCDRKDNRINRKCLSVENIMELHNLCRDKLGTGYYKIYNGYRVNGLGEIEHVSSIMGFDVRKPVKSV